VGSSNSIYVSRRTLGTNTWTTPINTGISITDISDDHNVIALGVDSTGKMHVSWDMHNVALNYGISNQVVNGSTFNSLTFTKQTAALAPTLFPSSGTTTNEVTYPEFYNIPGTNNLLFAYRNGGAGGGSGNGDQYLDVYNPTTGTWTNTKMINGQLTSVNAYLNGFVYNSQGSLLTTWTWRASPNWQTNSNIMFAQSPDNGTTWYKQGGSTQYTLPIIQSGSPAASVAQTVWNIPQGDSFINQTTMAVDMHDRPIVATYFAPGWNATSATSGSGNPNRQYMLVYYDGTQWRNSQVSNRTSDTTVDYSGSNVRDLGRPIVLVDKQNRVLVVMRYRDASNANNHDPNNSLVLAYTEDLMTGNTISNWNYLTLDNVNLGTYEPTYDSALWKSKGILDLFYEPVGLGSASAPVNVLEWNEQQFFAALHPHRGDFNLDGTVTNADIQPMLDAMTNLASYKSAHGLSDTDLLALGDINGDNVVDSADIPAFLNQLAGNSGAGGAMAVPELASGWLCSLGSLALACAAWRSPRSKSKSRTV
jgi:hypothetical protein